MSQIISTTSNYACTTNTVILTNTGTLITSGNSAYYSTSNFGKKLYCVFGEYVELFQDDKLDIIVPLLNTLGIKYYQELKNNTIYIPDVIEKIIIKNIKIQERDKKIEKILEK